MRLIAAAKVTEHAGFLDARQGWGVSLFLAGVVAVTLLATFATDTQYTALAILLGLPVGVWLVLAHPIWAVLVYITICASPFFGIYAYIEPGEYAAGALLILIFLRECFRGDTLRGLRRVAKPYYALFAVFVVSAVAALYFRNTPSDWAREQAQYLPLLLGPVVARNLRSREQVVFLVVASATLTIIALPFEVYQYIQARLPSYLTTEQLPNYVFERLPLPHFSAMNAATLSGLLGGWALMEKAKLLKVLKYILAAVVPALMFLALSRAWTAAAIGALLMPAVFLAGRRRLLKVLPSLLLATSLIVTGLYLTYSLLEVVTPQLAGALSERLEVAGTSASSESVYVRLEGAKYLLSVVWESPIWGHGLGYPVSLAPYKWAILSTSVSAFDNGHLALFIKFGLVGAFVFYWFFFHLGKQAYKVLKAEPDPLSRLVSGTFLAGLLIILILSFSYSALNFFDNSNFIGTWSGMTLWLRKNQPARD